jgi:hypothetical protein
LTDERSKVSDQLTLDHIVELHKKFPLLKGNDIERAKLLRLASSSNYKLVYNNEKNVVELRDLKNPESPVIKDNKVYTFENFAEDYYKGIGLWQVDARHQQQQQQQQGGGKDNKGISQPESDLQAALEALG